MNPAVLFFLGGIFLLLLMALVWVRTRRREERDPLAERLEQLRFDPAAGGLVEGGRVSAWRSFVDMLPRWLQVRLARADIEFSFISLGLGLAMILVAAAIVFHYFGPLAGVLAGAGLIVAALIVFQQIAARRIAAFVDGLPSFFDSMRQLLTIGNSLQQAVTKAIDNASPAVQRYTRPLGRRIQNGAPVGESVIWLARRLDVPEIHMLAAAVQTNLRYGGRMSHILSDLTAVIRDRARVNRELKAATSETRLSALVLGLLPFAVALFVFVLNPKYLSFFIDTEKGNQLLYLAIGLQVLGIMIMRRIIRLDF